MQTITALTHKHIAESKLVEVVGCFQPLQRRLFCFQLVSHNGKMWSWRHLMWQERAVCLALDGSGPVQ